MGISHHLLFFAALAVMALGLLLSLADKIGQGTFPGKTLAGGLIIAAIAAAALLIFPRTRVLSRLSSSTARRSSRKPKLFCSRLRLRQY